MQIIQEEIWRERQGPTLIMGDFNAIPITLESVSDMIEQDRWKDVGAKAHWWEERQMGPPAKAAKLRDHPDSMAFWRSLRLWP